ncbi:DUF3885 domain-containing protein [Halocynthiibacter sp.]|uniref:DUF3885 domain-containing protein n=1 Tax=Halocynthiibacter sp. TaxID=1979210 RepID=UPI003C373023
MTDIIGQFGSAFTCKEFPHAMFYEFEFGLRFELGGYEVPSSRPLKKFIQAFERADTISSTLFRNTKSLWVLSSSYGDKEPDENRLETFGACDIAPNSFEYLGASPQGDEEDLLSFGSDLFRHWDAVELDDQNRLREIIWLSLGREMAIQPSAKADIYVVDFEHGIALHAYDDRGMDVVSTDQDKLKVLYAKYKSWLLDHDMPRMQATFEN